MNRGSPRMEARRDLHQNGFNEAPIHESGKSVMKQLAAGRGTWLQ